MLDYDPHDWRAHLFDVAGSMIREIFARVAALTLWSVVIVLIHPHIHPIEMNSIMHSLFGLALSLLLVFRTNSSYDRFWEGRKLWGSTVNTCRNIARSSRVLLARAPDLRDRLVLWTIAFSDAHRETLRGTPNLGPIRGRLPLDEVIEVLSAQHVPLAIALKMSETFNEARRRGLLSDYLFVELDRNVHDLVDQMGACERIRKTPIPYVYMVHIRRALILYMATLPLILVGSMGWWTVPETFLMGYFFMGIEEIGVEIEDPFGHDVNDLPLEKICATIEANLNPFVEGNGESSIAAYDVTRSIKAPAAE